jgi:CBS domain containing-hemolysin-like protein
MIVPRDMKLPDLLKTLRQARAHLAVVLDEYGGTCGLVTLHDLFEEIVGDHIPDEEDGDSSWITELEKDVYVLNGRVELWEVNEDLDLELDESVARTIGGFVADSLGHLPMVGERLTIEEGDFIIEEVANNRVQRLRFVRDLSQTEEEDDS